MKLAAMAGAFAGFLALAGGVPAHAGLAVKTLEPGESDVFDHRMDPSDRMYSIAYKCHVPAGTIGAITLVRLSGEGSRHDLIVASNVSKPANALRYEVSNVIARQTGGTGLPIVALIPPDVDGWNRIFVVEAQDDIPARYRVYCGNADLAKALFMAGLETLISGSVSEYMGGGADDPVTGRALNLLWSLATRDNVMALGLDVVKDELARELARDYPGNPHLVTFLVATCTNILQDAYKHAFYEMSPRALRY